MACRLNLFAIIPRNFSA